MNKKLIILYIIMILVGIAMLFVINGRTPPTVEGNPQNIPVEPLPEPVKEKTENIVVIKALRDLPANTLIRSSDYQAETITVPENSQEKDKFSLIYQSIEEYGLKLGIKEGSFIPMTSLIPPSSSSEYIKMILQDGMLVYPFTLTKSDKYLLDNLKKGDLIDIYLIYGASDSGFAQKTVELISPNTNFLKTRIKPIVTNRRLLHIEEVPYSASMQSQHNVEGTTLLIELSQSEVKLIKSLEGNAKLFLFPSIEDNDTDTGSDVLFGEEAMWPVSSEPIFSIDALNGSASSLQNEIKELRGN